MRKLIIDRPMIKMFKLDVCYIHVEVYILFEVSNRK